MADLSITQTPLAGGKIRYTLGHPNWEDRRMPDIRRPGLTVQIEEQRLIDVIILGDGYTAAKEFSDALADWLQDFYAIKAYDVFAGCLRIRALYTPSTQRASASRGSYFGCPIHTDDKTGIESIAGDFWWQADDPDGIAFREAFWESIDSFDDVNLRRYPLDLDVGWNQAISNDADSDPNIHHIHRLRDLYRNLVVSMLVRSTNNEHPSGFGGDVARPAPDQTRHVRVAFGANETHEFSHTIGLLSDEYIHSRGLSDDTLVDPVALSVFSLSNLTYSNVVDDVPWLHLSPGGWQRRTASDQDPSPLVGWLWVGGYEHLGVWHSEYQCLMNGTHDNYQFTQVAAEDPTARPNGNPDHVGASLREHRLCLWCQELVTLRILEKTDQLLEDGDPGDLTSQGAVWYARWVELLRSNYYRLFDVAQQITDREASYAGLTPGRKWDTSSVRASSSSNTPTTLGSIGMLWQSDLYSVPKAAAAGPESPVPPLSDDEVFLLTGFAAIP